MNAGIRSSAAIDGYNTIYFGTKKRNFYALNVLTGEVRWSVSLGNAITNVISSPAIDPAGTVYFGTSGTEAIICNHLNHCD